MPTFGKSYYRFVFFAKNSENSSDLVHGLRRLPLTQRLDSSLTFLDCSNNKDMQLTWWESGILASAARRCFPLRGCPFTRQNFKSSYLNVPSTPQGLRHFLWILHWQWALLQSHKAIFFSHWDPFQLLWCFIHSTIYPRMPSTLPARLGYDLRDQVLNCIHQRRCNIHSFIIRRSIDQYALAYIQGRISRPTP